MAHKTLIGGTAYEITGGKTLVNGTAYSIKNGKTLVDGTAYEVGFSSMLTLTLIWEKGGYTWFDHSELGEEISDGMHEVSPGSVLTCCMQASISYSESYWAVYVNGTCVYSSYLRVGDFDSYTYTINKNITVTYRGDGDEQYIYIVEQ